MKRLLIQSAPLAFLLLAILVLTGAGCASTADDENASLRPWNTPKSWENGLPSTMTEGR